MTFHAGVLERVAGKTTADIESSQITVPTLGEEGQWKVAAGGNVMAEVAEIARMAGRARFSVHSR
jgi:hypothetical protein